MIRHHLVLRTLAVFLILEMLSTALLPTLSYALTSGPTAPEATSFEPVDTTDMVNLLTGDMTYNIPLLEVPGPSGGYPLSLSYHAGIMPGEEASWVGLGWTLNPGAISRTVNGFPDDYSNVNTSERIYWEGGEEITYTVGVSVGIKGFADISAGLSVSTDTYKGTSGLGWSLSAGSNFTKNSNFGWRATVGVSPWGGSFVSAGLTVGTSDAQMAAATKNPISSDLFTPWSAGVSVSSNASIHASASYGAVGVSMSSGMSGPSMSINGFSGSIHNARAGTISTQVTEFGGSIPILPMLSIFYGEQHVRYWMDEKVTAATNGTLYNPKSEISNFDLSGFDSYTVPISPTGNDPDFQAGPSFLSYDSYNVMAQGLGGTMRPYSMRNLAFRQSKKNKTGAYQIRQYPYDGVDYFTDKMEFRFDNEFSNKHQVTGAQWESGTPLGVDLGTTVADPNGNTIMSGEKLIGSRNIEWYSNKDIRDSEVSNFLECSVTGFDRNENPDFLIGGFRITNASGVTYHFNLPAYAFDEFQYSENTELEGENWNKRLKEEKYAYTWYLTAITGPDFVDRGNGETGNGAVGTEDWGYWVRFDYGKWTENYAWRNPEFGFDIDVDNDFQNYASGKREVYYLDAIQTATHTALFEKKLRQDSKGMALAMFMMEQIDKGFIPSVYINEQNKKVYGEDNPSCQYVPREYDTYDITYSQTTQPVSALALKAIYLMKNEDCNSVLNSYSSTIGTFKERGSLGAFNISVSRHEEKKHTSFPCDASNNCDCGQPSSPCTCGWNQHTQQNPTVTNETLPLEVHNGDLVLDESDFNGVSGFSSKAIRKIEFNTNYELVPETPNSFSHSSLYTANPSTDSASYTLGGKLTLASIKYLGNGGADILPPVSFSYDITNPAVGRSTITYSNSQYGFNHPNSGLIVGDIISMGQGTSTAYGLITAINGTGHTMKILGQTVPTPGASVGWKATKNPPYHSNSTDMWGHYKADFGSELPKDLSRVTTPLSSKSADVWSLRQIVTSQGATIRIGYEPDTYTSGVLQNSHNFVVKTITRLSCPSQSGHEPQDPDEPPHGILSAPPVSITCSYRIDLYNEGIDLRDLFAESEIVGCIFPYSYMYNDPNNGVQTVNQYSSYLYTTAVGSNYIIGNVSFPEGSTLYGATVSYGFNKSYAFSGGYRVNTVELTDQLAGKSTATRYSYDHNGVSSGVTSFEPDLSDKVNMLRLSSTHRKITTSALASTYGDVEKFIREAPAPGAVYKYVTVSQVANSNGVESGPVSKSKYEFEMLSKNMLGEVTTVTGTSGSGSTPLPYSTLSKREITISNFTSHVGKLKAIQLLDNSDAVVSETRYEYLIDKVPNHATILNASLITEYGALLSNLNSQGLVQETIWDGRYVKNSNNSFDLLGVVSKRHTYPAILVSEKNTNYKTGITVKTENIAFDFYTGEVTKNLYSDGNGNFYITEKKPAYRISEYSSAMKPLALGGRNMLSQEASQFTYKVTSSTNYQAIGLVGASVQTWSNQIRVLRNAEYATETTSQSEVWRKKGSYSYVGETNSLRSDGLYQLTNNALPVFTAGAWLDVWDVEEATPAGWQLGSEITLYDVFSHALEAKDVNRLAAATKLSLNSEKVYSTIANADYFEYTYSGAEDTPQNDGRAGGGVIINGTRIGLSHTGQYGVAAINGRAFSFTARPYVKNYIANVWANRTDALIKYRLDANPTVSSNVSVLGRAGEWYLLQASLSVASAIASSQLEVWCESGPTSTAFDDFRVLPYDAAMTGYVYNQWGEVSHIIDNNHLYTEYRYDEMGKLKETYKETFVNATNSLASYGNEGIVKVSEFKYNYGAKTPFTVPITVSHTGAGSVFPDGLITLRQGADQSFQTYDYCNAAAPPLVFVDGAQINLSVTEHSLFDGGKLKVTNDILTFSKIMSGHTLNVQYYVAPIGGTATCHLAPHTVGGVTYSCYNGTIDYRVYDECGTLGPIINVNNVNLVPSFLLSQLPQGGCPTMGGPNCNQ